MRRAISEGIWIGDENDCFHGERDGWAVVHACKTPCHQKGVGYRGNLSSSHEHYLVLEHAYHLYLNMIDPDKPLFMPPLFTEFLKFARRVREEERELLIHCNQGASRAPSLGLLYMAKVSREVSNDSYEKARSQYEAIDPRYRPGLGIQTFLSKKWDLF